LEDYNASAFEPVLHVRRGQVVESMHAASVAVVDPEGELQAWWGDPRVITYSRSSAKPFQAAALVEAGGQQKFSLNLEEVAITCASHSGTDRHADVLRGFQHKIAVGEQDLLCGTHTPGDRATAEQLIRDGLEPTPIRHNCSGKHTGMLALAKLRGDSTENYINLEHPVQQVILRTFAEICGIPLDQITTGMDGCSVPVYAAQLQAFARGYARLADPSGFSPLRENALHLIFQAMTTHPYMVAGPGSFDTTLMQATGGRLVSKGGAEGFQGIGIPRNARWPGSPALGVAIKIADGDPAHRAGSAVAVSVLLQLGALSEQEADAVLPQDEWIVRNSRGIAVGELVPVFTLHGDLGSSR